MDKVVCPMWIICGKAIGCPHRDTHMRMKDCSRKCMVLEGLEFPDPYCVEIKEENEQTDRAETI